MSSKVRADDKYIVCPLYKSRRTNSISCEGLFPRSTIIHQIDRPRDLRTQIDIFCTTRNYKKCEIYRAVIAARYMEEME